MPGADSLRSAEPEAIRPPTPRGARWSCAPPVLYEASSEFPISTGAELYPNGSVPKVYALANVPRPNLAEFRRVFSLFASWPTPKTPIHEKESRFLVNSSDWFSGMRPASRT